ncbi:MAG: transcription antitermination factor NusB [Candidatus Omnitrophica bacterium]|nr:transcription antitermination factor NusB [Candidatus Omnitrophota bacterium]MCM8825419.1 transcription antitermination factor NusB [Candidatus Omnitrophota bacterium]
MKKVARKARIIALEICYQLDIENLMDEKDALRVLKEKDIDGEIYLKAEMLVLGVVKNLTFIDELLSKYSTNWDISRMSYVDRNILRIAVYEMLFAPDVPDVVVINEAIEISKIYSGADSGKFINGLLDRIMKERICFPRGKITK